MSGEYFLLESQTLFFLVALDLLPERLQTENSWTYFCNPTISSEERNGTPEERRSEIAAVILDHVPWRGMSEDIISVQEKQSESEITWLHIQATTSISIHGLFLLVDPDYRGQATWDMANFGQRHT
jgi:hypothetical protein